MPVLTRAAFALTGLLALTLAHAARADFPDTVTDHVLPGYAAFEDATRALADKSVETCAPGDLAPAYHAAFDAWMAVQHLRFGPVETDGRGLAVLYWPDPKALGAKAQMALLTGDPAKLTPENFADQSVAARGFLALERLLFPEIALPADPCPLIRATSVDLARIAGLIHADWQNGFALSMITAGDPGNTLFLTRPEARQSLFTQLASGLEFLDDSRLGRPMGAFDTPHPERAEARASGRSLRNVLISLQSMRQMVETLTPDAPETLTSFDRAIRLATELDDPVFAGVATPQGRLKVEALQQAVHHIREVILTELAREMDVGIGFNAADGD